MKEAKTMSPDAKNARYAFMLLWDWRIGGVRIFDLIFYFYFQLAGATGRP
jgi:hypothetical protein